MEGGGWRVDGGGWMVEGGGWRAEEGKGISLFYCTGLMCLQHWLKCGFPKKLFMKTINSSCYFLDQATLTLCELDGISVNFCQKKTSKHVG